MPVRTPETSPGSPQPPISPVVVVVPSPPPAALPVVMPARESSFKEKHHKKWPPFLKNILAPLFVTVVGGIILILLTVGTSSHDSRPRPEASPDSPSIPPSSTSPTTPARPSTMATPTCPKCGGPMVLRRNRTTGEPFWGCKQFPKCRGTLPYNGAAGESKSTSRRSTNKSFFDAEYRRTRTTGKEIQTDADR